MAEVARICSKSDRILQSGEVRSSQLSLARHRLSKCVESLPFPVHAHMLRHGTGYPKANRGTDTRTIQSYLGHNNIQHTVRYTELVSGKFQGLWEG